MQRKTVESIKKKLILMNPCPANGWESLKKENRCLTTLWPNRCKMIQCPLYTRREDVLQKYKALSEKYREKLEGT